jgi:alkanesulfonate monooxygenase SsuD/methylene tetrahydromethanopterin reductase-like flavin-dependent oxidoreductase (luciferase family)
MTPPVAGPGFGLMLPTFDSLGTGLAPLAEYAQTAEGLGYDSIWAGDHLFFHVGNVETLIALAHVSAVTSTIRLGTGVLLPALRDPVLMTKQLLSLDALSGGRLMVGVGTGGEFEAEWSAARVPLAGRGPRTDEALQIMRRFMAGGPIDHAGDHFTITAPEITPAATRDIPIWVGGRSDPALRRTVSVGAGWLTMWVSPGRVDQERARLAEWSAAAGRATPPRIGLFLLVNIDTEKEARIQAERFVGSHYRMPLSKIERWSAFGPAEHVAALLKAYQAVGVTDVVLFPASDDLETQYTRIAELRTEWTS